MKRAGRIWTLSERDAQCSAAQKLQAAVQALTRAKWLQILAECLWTGLFWGLAVSCVAVLFIRFGMLPYTIAIAVTSLMGIALMAAAVIAWQRRPDPLQVAILADMQLHLKQKLSTAWEFARLEADPTLTESLTVQAIRARLPARPELVFPLRINIWGRLTPLAVVLLLLLGIVDLHQIPQPTAAIADERVVAQGVQLREYAHQMQTRTQRDNLIRSSAQSQAMQRLGNRMASGGLLREQALNRLHQLSTALGEQRRAALSEGLGLGTDAGRVETLAAHSIADMHAGLEDLAAGRVQTTGLRFDGQTLPLLGITPEALERALASFEAGDGQGLHQLLEKFARIEQALREAEELDKAQQKLQRVRENLDDTDLPNTVGSNEALSASGEGSFSGDHSGAEFLQQDRAIEPGRGSDFSVQGSNQQASPFTPPSQSVGVVLKPASQLSEGKVFSAPARALPRSGQPTLETIELDARFAAQVEEVLSKEEYPLHQKELIRRYFLTLSEGVSAEDAGAGRP